MTPHLLGFVIAGSIAAGLTAALVRVAPRLGLIDAPGPRKVHARPTPRGGGIAIYLGVLLAALLRPGDLLQPPALVLLGLGGAVALLGLIDDCRPLPWQLRLTVQLLAAFAAVGLGFAPASWLAWAVGVLWVAGLTNAFNMLDNMDALAAGTAWIATAALVVVWLTGPEEGTSERLFLGVLLMGALTGFLWFNRPPARIFMGDVGSTFLGFFLGVATLGLASPTTGEGTWLVPLFLLAVPCYDMTSVVLLRLRQGRSPFHADKQHLSHRLVALGLSSPLAVALIHGLALVSGGAAVALAWTTTEGRWLVVGAFVAGWGGLAAFELVAAFRRPREGLT